MTRFAFRHRVIGRGAIDRRATGRFSIGRFSTGRARAVAGYALIALALILAQRAASLHWLAHAVAATHAHAAAPDAPSDGGLVADHCDECTLFAALGAGAAAAIVAVGSVDTAALCPQPFGSTAEARAPPLAFRSRAPPIPA